MAKLSGKSYFSARIVAAMVFASCSFAHAQFYSVPSPNLQIITNNVASEAFRDSVRISSAQDDDEDTLNSAALSFKPSAAVRQRNISSFIGKTREQSEENASQMEQLFASIDVFSAMAKELATVDLRIDNVADAYTVYWITAWEASRGISGTKTSVGQAQAVKAQAARALLSLPQFTGSTAAQKQELAEALLIQTALIGGSMGQANGDKKLLSGIAKAVRQGAKAMAIDLDSMQLEENGFSFVQ